MPTRKESSSHEEWPVEPVPRRLRRPKTDRFGETESRREEAPEDRRSRSRRHTDHEKLRELRESGRAEWEDYEED